MYYEIRLYQRGSWPHHVAAQSMDLQTAKMYLEGCYKNLPGGKWISETAYGTDRGAWGYIAQVDVHERKIGT